MKLFYIEDQEDSDGTGDCDGDGIGNGNSDEDGEDYANRCNTNDDEIMLAA